MRTIMRISKAVYGASLLVLLVGCVSTPLPYPVSIKEGGDKELDCSYLHAEYKANTEIATAKISKNESDDVNDALIGFFVWPGLADFNNAPGHEGNSLLDRNVWLKNLAEVQNCDISDWPKQPTRY